jgi:hypothetical protein
MRSVALMGMLLGSLLALTALSATARADEPTAQLTAEQRKELEAKTQVLFQEAEH